jgi:hypothetical protein
MLRINSPCTRRRSGRWHQQRPSRYFPFILAQVSQDPVDDVLVLDTCDDPDRSSTKTADLDKVNRREASREGALGHVDVENSL